MHCFLGGKKGYLLKLSVYSQLFTHQKSWQNEGLHIR
jgi:hypothetical protein